MGQEWIAGQKKGEKGGERGEGVEEVLEKGSVEMIREMDAVRKVESFRRESVWWYPRPFCRKR